MRRFKRLEVTPALLVFSTVVIPPSLAWSAAHELVFLNWSDYMDLELIANFENKCQVRATQVYFESDDMRDEFLSRVLQ